MSIVTSPKKDEREFTLFGKPHARQWYLYALINETKYDYTYARAEIMDKRPIPEICAVLAKHWSDEKLALKLVKSGDIIHLGSTLKECVFGDKWTMKSDPEGGALWNKFIKWCGSYWRADWYGRCEPIEKPQRALTQANLF